MYGLVNKAIEDLVCSRYGEDVWDESKKNANVDTDAFIGTGGSRGRAEPWASGPA